MNTNTTYTGHNIDIMSTFPDKCIDCIITSPPYYQLRDYGTEHQIWGDSWKGELGHEPTFQQYINHLVEVFKECKRVMKDEGTMWVNLGDSYSGSGNGSGDTTITNRKKPETYKKMYKNQKTGVQSLTPRSKNTKLRLNTSATLLVCFIFNGNTARLKNNVQRYIKICLLN